MITDNTLATRMQAKPEKPTPVPNRRDRRAAARRATCPCGSQGHALADHPEHTRTAWHPVLGEYKVDDVIFEHAQGEHDAHPDPESCPVCPS